jgi:hypothetical protein
VCDRRLGITYGRPVRKSEFAFAVTEEFGAYGSVITHDLVLGEVADVPRERWYGRGRPKPDASA